MYTYGTLGEKKEFVAVKQSAAKNFKPSFLDQRQCVVDLFGCWASAEAKFVGSLDPQPGIRSNLFSNQVGECFRLIDREMAVEQVQRLNRSC